jgi:integrase
LKVRQLTLPLLVTGPNSTPPGTPSFRYYDEHGRQREKSAPTLTGAKQLRAKLVLEAKERKRNLRPSAREDERRRLTVADLIERYWPEFAAKKSARTTQAYRDVWKRDLGRLLAAEVVTGDIETWRREQQLKGMSNTTINHYCSWLKALFNLGIRDHLLDANPLAKGRIKKLPQSDPRDRVLTFQEERQLLPELEPRDRAAYVIALYAGLRQSEVLRLERSDIDFDKASAKLRDTKAGKTQRVHLNAAALEAISWVMSQHGHDLLFPNEEGTGPMSGSRLTDRVKAAAKRLGLQDVLFHTAKYTFTTRLGEDCRMWRQSARRRGIPR